MPDDPLPPATGAEALLLALKRAGVDFLFANAGTDFPPIIEALAALPGATVPTPVTVPHETAAVAMAHGHWLVTGRPQAAMLHTNVGLANAVMGVINAAADDVPVLVLSGRTPITEAGRPGSRSSQIHYGQEMYDQAALVRELTKAQLELRYPEEAGPLVARAAALAQSAPAGPVYLSLPREPLMEPHPAAAAATAVPPPATPGQPDPDAIARAAAWLAAAERPLILAQRGDPAGRLGAALSAFAARHGVPVAEPFPVRNLLASADPMLIGYDAHAPLADADLVLVLDAPVPWIESAARPRADARVVQVGPDPHFRRMPVRGHRADLAIAADPLAALAALDAALPAPGPAAARRRATTAERSAARRAAARDRAEAGRAVPMSAAWMSRCIGKAMDAAAVLFTELGVQPGAMEIAGPNRVFGHAHSGGLGWALPAALGAQLADRRRLTVACMGDGSYIFANPVACHQIAEALDLPILTVVKNNAAWNAVRRSVVASYPGGAAARASTMPLTSLAPVPDFAAIARASRAHAERVEHGDDLPAALARAIDVIRRERRQALVDVRVAASDAD